ncbi:MAG: hypothetical protein Kow00127_00080 [Bacteroidales bacterium]
MMRPLFILLLLTAFVFSNSVTAQRSSNLENFLSGLPVIFLHEQTPEKSDVRQVANPQADTLHYPLPGEYAVYVSPDGYVSGNNSFGDLAKADYFEVNGTLEMTGILIDFAWATQAASGNTMIEIAVWDDAKDPGNKLGSEVIPLSSIVEDVQQQQTTYVEFDPPVPVSSAFYAGVLLPQSPGDTVVIFTNTNGDTSPATAWEQWSDGTWVRYDDPDMGWGLEVSHAIFPIVVPQNGLTANFSASATLITPGTTVTFTDLSSGNPDQWEWQFEGGNPVTSGVQNPSVTYNNTGQFDVELTVHSGLLSDTEIKENYIVVVDSVPNSSTDTLNFPLPGTPTVYILNQNGGYVTGNNQFNDKAKANFFQLSKPALVTGVLYRFAVAHNATNPQIELALWSHHAALGHPVSQTGSEMVPLESIAASVQNQALFYQPFDPPVEAGNAFYAGFYIPQTGQDTLALFSNADGETNPGTAWELWSDDTWVPFSAENSWQLNIALAIHPVVEYLSGIEEATTAGKINFYPNPATDEIKIGIPDGARGKMSVTISTMTGRQIYSTAIPQGVNTAEINLSEIPPGIYLLTFKDENGVLTSKLIKTP